MGLGDIDYYDVHAIANEIAVVSRRAKPNGCFIWGAQDPAEQMLEDQLHKLLAKNGVVFDRMEELMHIPSMGITVFNRYYHKTG
jgi:hypothetical protein